MSILFNAQSNNCRCCLQINLPSKASAIKVAAIAFLVIGALGVVYTLCGFTSLSQTSSFFIPLHSISHGGLAAMVAGFTAVGVGGSIVLIVLCRKPKAIEINLSAFTVPSSQLHLDKIKAFLESGYRDYLEYYAFYYHLAQMTELISKNSEDVKNKWEAFLQEIDGREILQKNGRQRIKIDSRIELARLSGQLPELQIEEKQTFSDDELSSMYRIYSEAFSSDNPQTKEGVRRLCTSARNRVFVIHHASTKEILGCVMLSGDLSRDVCIHTLARSAHAVKLNMTEMLKSHLLPIVKQDYSYVWCRVLKDNLPAQQIYIKLGFQKVKENREDFTYAVDLSKLP